MKKHNDPETNLRSHRRARLLSHCVAAVTVTFMLQGCSSSGNSGTSTTAAATSTVGSTSTLALSGAATSVASGSTLQFTASGGTSPYSYSISGTSDSTIDVSSGLLTAGATASSLTVMVIDSAANIAYAYITVVASTTSAVTTNSVTYAAGSFSLAQGSAVAFSDGGQLAFQGDGNLVSYDSTGNALWSSGTGNMSCATNCSAIFQADGNFVLYQNGAAYWTSATAGANIVISETSPYISILDASGNQLWSAVGSSGLLSQVTYTLAGAMALEASQQVPVVGAYLTYQADGNLVVYSSSGAPLWNSGTASYSCSQDCFMNWQADGNLVLYQNGTAYWSSQTAGTGASFVISGTAPYLSILNGSGTAVWTSQ